MGFLAFLLKIFLFYMFFRFILRLLLGPVVRGGRANFFDGFAGRGPGTGGNHFGPDEPRPKQKKPGRFENEEIIEGEFEEIDSEE